MTFSSIPAGAGVFLDANTLIYHFTNDSAHGSACTQLVKRAELRQVQGYTSSHALADVAHRLMTVEAMQLKGWPQAGIASRLRKNHHEIPNLSAYLLAIASLHHLNLQVLPVTLPLVEAAAPLSQQHELLTGDALIVAMMQQHGLTNLASNDPDFDRVPGIIRYEPA